MKIYKKFENYNESIENANFSGSHNEEVIFHAYWTGRLRFVHFVSIFSCFYFNIQNNEKFKIILWVNKTKKNKFYKQINKFAEIREFNFEEEIKDTIFEKELNYKTQSKPTHQANLYRTILLFNYGGCWFDLDVFFLRSFEPLFNKFKNEICLYQWESENYPNNAIYFSLEKKSKELEKNIEYIISKKQGWGFQQANLTIDAPLNFLVLPCAWFDASWLDNPYKFTWDNFFQKSSQIVNFENFFPGAYAFHWHNRWTKHVHKKSPLMQLFKIIFDDYKNSKLP